MYINLYSIFTVVILIKLHRVKITRVRKFNILSSYNFMNTVFATKTVVKTSNDPFPGSSWSTRKMISLEASNNSNVQTGRQRDISESRSVHTGRTIIVRASMYPESLFSQRVIAEAKNPRSTPGSMLDRLWIGKLGSFTRDYSRSGYPAVRLFTFHPTKESHVILLFAERLWYFFSNNTTNEILPRYVFYTDFNFSEWLILWSRSCDTIKSVYGPLDWNLM